MKAVKGFGIDIEVDVEEYKNMKHLELEELIAKALEEYGIKCLGCMFNEDLTDVYCNEYGYDINEGGF